MDSLNAIYHPHLASLFFSYVYLPRPLTPHDEQDSEPPNKLNRITVLSRKRTNHIILPSSPLPESFFLGLALAEMSGRSRRGL